MNKAKKEAIMKARTFDELLDAEYGKPGTPEREQFDADAAAFCLAETLKAERLKAGLTQEQLAERIGTKKTYISRLPNLRGPRTTCILDNFVNNPNARAERTIIFNYGYSCKNLPISASFYRVRLNFDKSFADKQTLFGLYMAFLPQL